MDGSNWKSQCRNRVLFRFNIFCFVLLLFFLIKRRYSLAFDSCALFIYCCKVWRMAEAEMCQEQAPVWRKDYFAELVDVALGVLAEVSPRLPFTPSAAQVEQELQAAPSQAPGGTASMEEGSNRSPGPPSSSGASTDAERTGLDDSDDDALKYVREIFFT
uniref:Uncharacterized protein n=1 Tax=Meleagris gallopavo TaxID=9103 RepID=A0A803YGC3_MELGA